MKSSTSAAVGKKKKLIIHPSHPGWQFETRHYYVNLQNSHRQKIRFVHGRKKKKKMEERNGKEDERPRPSPGVIEAFCTGDSAAKEAGASTGSEMRHSAAGGITSAGRAAL